MKTIVIERSTVTTFIFSIFGKDFLKMKKKTNAGKASNEKVAATPSMINVAIKDGVVHIPSTWIQLNPKAAANCKYAGIVSCLNATKYGIPIFVFFSDYAKGSDYPRAFQNSILEMCKNAWKPFKSKVLDKQVEPIKDALNPSICINEKEHLASPYIGIFSLPDEDEDVEPAYGAYIARN